MKKKTLVDLTALAGHRVLTRVDFNVPLDGGRIADDARIIAAMPTIKALSDSGARVILISHLGRPNGHVRPECSLRPVADRLVELLGRKVVFADDCIGSSAVTLIESLVDGDVCLLENLRFHPGEAQNDQDFAHQLARHGDVYVNDAFGTAHRAHASTVGVTEHIDPCVAGLLMHKELEFFDALLARPRRPFYAVLGGAKVSGKLEVIANLMDTVDGFMIGGGMAFTFLKARGLAIGRSLVEDELIDEARQITDAAAERGKAFLLPVDVVCGADINTGTVTTVDVHSIPTDLGGFDIGARTAGLFEDAVGTVAAQKGTIFWNGPMGVFENPKFSEGTVRVANAIARATDSGATTVVGGGDSVAAIHQLKIDGSFSHISTGGGASLEFMEGKSLPGVAALDDRD